MTLFQYPNVKHRRKLSPRQFKRYRSYKRFLQTEFARVCVYCRQSDCSAPNIAFGVDHYRPKGIARFENLICSYENLYYCCSGCNSRKSDYWPVNEDVGPYVVNPCDYAMLAHLSFDPNTGRVEPKSLHGIHTEQLLQLNDDASVQYRLGTLKTVRLYSLEIEQQERKLKMLTARLRKSKISKHDYESEVHTIKNDLAILRRTKQSHAGELPLPPLMKKRLGLVLLERS